MARRLVEMAASIVKAQAAVGKISPEEVELILTKTFFVLQRLQKAELLGILVEPGQASNARNCDVGYGEPACHSERLDSRKQNRVS